jgi:Kef-type K+ transport system membrane component KefB/CBS domain-containing protein
MPSFLPLVLAMFVAFPLGRLCARFSIPRVTGYLLTGILLGPSVLGQWGESLPAVLTPFFLSREVVHSLGGVTELAQALILFLIGAGLKVESLRGLRRRGFLLSGLEIGLTFGLTAFLLLLVSGFENLRLALVLAAAAVATAPAATMLVLRELDSEGPMTSRIVTLVGLDNIASLLLFALLFGSLYLDGPWDSLGDLGIGALVGFLSGIVLSGILRQLPTPTAFAVLGLAGTLTAWGVAVWLGGSPLLACLIMGATLANACPYADAVRQRLRDMDYPIYVAFFVLAGSELHLELLLGLHVPAGLGTFTILILSATYVLSRSLGKIFSAPLAARWAGSGDKTFKRTGLALMAQAGLAIALANSALDSGVADGVLIQAVILATVTVFELVGPLCVRHAVVHAGEVKLLNLLPEQLKEGIGAGLVDSLGRLRRSLGLPALPRHKKGGELRAIDLMRRSFDPIQENMPFEEVVHLFAQSPYDQYPVVGEYGGFLGVISYPEIRMLLFDDSLQEVVIAADLITGPGVTCTPDTTLSEIIGIFEDCNGEFSHLPVVEQGETPRVVGIIDQRGAMVAYRRHGSG